MGPGWNSPKGPQPEKRRNLGPGRGPHQMAQKSKERERAARWRRGAALAPATPRALAAGRAAARRQGLISCNRCAPRRLAASRQAVSVQHRRAARTDPVGRAPRLRARPRRTASALPPQAGCRPGSRAARAPEAGLRFRTPPSPAPNHPGWSLTRGPRRAARCRRPPLRSFHPEFLCGAAGCA